MLEAFLRRLLQSGVVLLAMSVIAFAGINLVGDPVHLLVRPDATQEEVAEVKHELGLDRPVLVQYGMFLDGVVHGRMGNSFVYSQPALPLIFERMPATFELAVTAMLFSLLLGVPLGLAAGMRPNGLARRLVMGASIVGVTVPAFWSGLILILVFSVNAGWLPSGGRGATVPLWGVPVSFLTLDGLRHLLLPGLTLSLMNVAMIIRLTEAGTREVVGQEYVKFARAKGISNARLMARHIAPNVMIPVITAAGLEFAQLISFSVVTESVFAWPGMGKLIIDSILQLDRPVVVAYLLVTVVLFVSINFIVDTLYLLLDPRLRVNAR